MATFKQYEKKDGKKYWMFSAYLGKDPLTGKDRRTTKRGFRTQKEAKLALSRLQVEIDKKGLHTPNNMTFNELAELWMSNYQTTVKASTYSRTKIILNKHLLPKFGKLNVQKITTAYCQKVVNEWSKTIKQKRYTLFVNYLNKIFKLGINMRVIEINPITNIIIPQKKEDKIKENKIRHYDKMELEVFLNTIESEENEFFRLRDYTLFRLLAFSGCRIGEILAMTWDDLDFKKKEISINKTVTKGEQYYISETPKTSGSKRTVILDDKTIMQLKRWKLMQMRWLLAHGYNKPSHIFTNDKNHFTINGAVTERYKIYRDRAYLHDIGLHGFRHTHASLLFESGASMKEVQERLGHTNIKTTMDIYTHVTDSKKAETTEKLANYINF